MKQSPSLLFGIEREESEVDVLNLNARNLVGNYCWLNQIRIKNENWNQMQIPAFFRFVITNPPYITIWSFLKSLLLRASISKENCWALISRTNKKKNSREGPPNLCPKLLKKKGGLLSEHNHNDGPFLRQLISKHLLGPIKTIRDLGGLPRISASLPLRF
jgi:methylase of polypeptide subunit release factors